MVDSITDVPGVRVGHVTDSDAATGVTVLTFGEPNGAIVDVKYNPKSPSDAVVDHFFSKHFLAMILFPIGFLFSLVGFILGMTTKPDQATKPS